MKSLTLKNRFLNRVNPYFKSFKMVLCTTLLLTSAQTIVSHGTVTSPPSRVWVCFQEDPQTPDSAACEAAIRISGTQQFYDWSEVARMDAGGNHRAIIGPGNLASAGRPDKYGGIDQVRNDWVSTRVSPGPFEVIWTNSAPHKTLYYDVYITKADWTPDMPLTWDNIELLTRTNPRDAAATDIINVTLPERRGKHVIYSVWQRSLTPEAFYSTSDVDFGNGGSPIDVPNNAPPVADIKIASVSGRTVTFDASGSTDPDGDALTYRYSYGDRDQDQNVGPNPTHTYNNARSSYSVTVTVTDTAGLSDTATVVVNFNGDNPTPPPPPSDNTPPVAVVVVTPGATGTAPFAVRFDASASSDADGDSLTYDISYGNGNMGTNLNVNSPYTYFTPGTYTATLTVRDGRGGADTASVTITVTPPDNNNPNTAPVANLVVTPGTTGTAPFAVRFDASGSTDADGDTLTYDITYGNGNMGTNLNADSPYTYFNPGTYTATLTVRDGNGGVDTASVSITVNPANDTPPPPPNGDLCNFGTPSASPLATTYGYYTNVYVLGTNGPDLSNVNGFSLNWDLANNGLWSIALQTSNGVPAYYISLDGNVTNNLASVNPSITFSNVAIPGFDGEYDVAAVNSDIVFAAKNGEYAIYFSNSPTAPNCSSAKSLTNELLSASISPNPATTSVSVQNSSDLQGSLVTISDMSGSVVKSLNIESSTTTETIDVSSINSGLYLMTITDNSGSSRVLKLIIK